MRNEHKERHAGGDLPVVVYSPDSAISSPDKAVREMYADLRASTGLAWRLTIRDISAQYRQSYLGLLWAFILPLTNTLVWVFLSSSGIVAVSKTTVPYPVFVFVGTILWSVLVDAVNAPLQQSNSAKQMLAKLNFPREAIILSGIYTTLFNAGIRIVLLLAILPLLGVPWSATLLLFPLALFSIVLTGTAIGLTLTPLGLLYTDVTKGLPLLMQALMYSAPVVFPVPEEGWGRIVLTLNPLAPLIVTGRDWLTGSTGEYLLGFVVVTAFFGLLLFAAWAVFRLAMPILIERMSS